jgi:TM2 domain-containing membrane protein YozV
VKNLIDNVGRGIIRLLLFLVGCVVCFLFGTVAGSILFQIFRAVRGLFR